MKRFCDLKVGDSFYMWYDGEFYGGVILSIRKTEYHIETYTKFKKENCENFYTSYHCISEIDSVEFVPIPSRSYKRSATLPFTS